MTATRRTNPREERRLLQQELGRTQLLDAAEEIFGTKGFHETTLKEIADRADFSVGSVYSFFENKDDLYESVWLRRGAEFLAGFEEALSGSSSGLDGIARIVTYEVEFLRARPSFADLYLRTTGSLVPVANDQTSDRIVENARHILGRQAEVIVDGQADGSVRGGDPAALSRLLSGMVQSFQAVDSDAGRSPGAALGLDVFLEIVSAAFGVRS
jgi:AcrR family transcriptional regulator